MKVKHVDDLDENWRSNVPCQHTCAQSGTCRSSHLFAVHNHTFHEGWMDTGQTDIRMNEQSNEHTFATLHRSYTIGMV